MPSEELNDEVADEQPSDIEGTEDIEEDVAEGEEEYSYEAEAPTGGGGSSVGIWIIIVLVIVALIGLGYYQWNKAMTEQAEKEAAQRQKVRENQLRSATRDIPDAQDCLQRGDIDGMIESLKEMDEKLEIIGTSANQAGDTEAAMKVKEMRGVVQDAIKDLEPAYEEFKAQRKKLQETANSKLKAIGQEFSAYGGDVGADTEQEAPAEGEEPAPEEEGGDEEPAVGEDEAPEDQEPPAEDEEAVEDAEEAGPGDEVEEPVEAEAPPE